MRWLDTERLVWEQADRVIKRFRVIQVNLPDGRVSSIVDERSETFIWTAHTENNDLAKVTWLDESHELIFVTEQSAGSHLQLIDVAFQQAKNWITSGNWIVRGIERIDKRSDKSGFALAACSITIPIHSLWPR